MVVISCWKKPKRIVVWDVVHWVEETLKHEALRSVPGFEYVTAMLW